MRCEGVTNRAGGAGSHIAHVLGFHRGIETFALHRGLDVGDIAFALVHIFHRDRVFLAGDHLVGHYGITDFEPVRLTDRHGNLDIGLA